MKSKCLHLYVVTIITALTLTFGTQANAVSLEAETFTLVCDEWPPFQYVGDNGKPTGYSVEILQAILKELNIKDEIEFYPWKRAFMLAETGKMDGSIIWGLRSDRAEKFYYSDSVLSAKYVFFHLKEYPFKWENLNDLKNIKNTT